MDDEYSDKSIEFRPPTVEDLLKLCKSLNEKNVNYIVVGGMAMIYAGFSRTTVDIDLLIDASEPNMEKIKDALSYLPDNAAGELELSDVEKYTVVKVADEIVIDLMKSACGVSYEEVSRSVHKIKIKDVEIPFPSIEFLYKMKQTLREKDRIDRLFLEELLRKKK